MLYDLSRRINYNTVDIDALTNAANEGDASALFLGAIIKWAGYNHDVGGVEGETAYEWLKTGAELRDPMCMGYYGISRYLGIGMRADNKEGFPYVKASKNWIIESAANGSPYAQHILGMFYKRGAGVGLSSAQAVSEFLKASEAGEAGAQYDLARCYQDGVGVNKEMDRFVYWCEKAAKQGHAPAQSRLAYVSAMDLKDPSTALYWFRKAADQGYPLAQTYTGFMLSGGFWSKHINQIEACEWFQKAADRGDILGTLELIKHLDSGIGIEGNHAKAYQLCLDLLARNGETVATVAMDPPQYSQAANIMRQMRASAKRITADGDPNQKGLEFPDGTQAWEQPTRPTAKQKPNFKKHKR